MPCHLIVSLLPVQAVTAFLNSYPFKIKDDAIGIMDGGFGWQVTSAFAR